MIQVYSNGVSVAAGGTYPLNNVTFYKGNTAVQSAAGSVALNKRGVYIVQVDGFATLATAGTYSIQLTRNGVPVPQAISTTSVAAGEIGSGSFTSLITVAENDCPCNWTTSAVTLGIVNPETAEDITEGHINMIITKLC